MSTLTLGDVVGSYRVEAELGAGKTATVWRVRHLHQHTVRALKLLELPRKALSERLWREGLAQSRVVHRNVVIVHERLVHQGHPALILDYVDGPTLAELLERGPLEPSEAAGIALDLIHGVRAAHQLGIVHRDLKPANLLLQRVDRRWLARVADFGLARWVGPSSELTRAGVQLGTPRYMSPEQALDPRNVDARADLFSIGCVMYELFSGRHAFPGDDALTVLDAISAGEHQPLGSVCPELPAEVVRAVERCLQVDRERRPASCDELLDLLGATSGDRPVPPPPPPTPRLGPTWQRLVGGALLALCVSALLAGAGAIAGLILANLPALR